MAPTLAVLGLLGLMRVLSVIIEKIYGFWHCATFVLTEIERAN